jgi:hypothetical protein
MRFGFFILGIDTVFMESINNTAISDKGIALLQSLSKLQYLNIVATKYYYTGNCYLKKIIRITAYLFLLNFCMLPVQIFIRIKLHFNSKALYRR